jgi:hypothetical protein
MAMSEPVARPRRPLGVSLAIVLFVGLFAVIPMFQIVIRLLVQARLSALNTVEVTMPNGEVVQPLASGGYENLINPTAVLVQLAVCAWVVAVGVMAWRGKPRSARWLFTGTVLVFAALTLWVAVGRVLVSPSVAEGVSSADVVGGWEWVQVVGSSLLLPLYTVWYMNRAPARAFFGGNGMGRVGSEGS